MLATTTSAVATSRRWTSRPFFRGRIEGQAFLVAVDLEIGDPAAVLLAHPVDEAVLAAFDLLHPDDLRPEVAEQGGAPGPRDVAAEIQNPYPFKHSRHLPLLAAPIPRNGRRRFRRRVSNPSAGSRATATVGFSNVPDTAPIVRLDGRSVQRGSDVHPARPREAGEGVGPPTVGDDTRGSPVPSSVRPPSACQGSFTLRDRFARVNPVRSNRSGTRHGPPAREWDGRTAADRCGRDTSVPRTRRSQEERWASTSGRESVGVKRPWFACGCRGPGTRGGSGLRPAFRPTGAGVGAAFSSKPPARTRRDGSPHVFGAGRAACDSARRNRQATAGPRLPLAFRPAWG